MDGIEGCLACDLAAGRRPLHGGSIHETAHWIVEHCVGPLGVGALLVKPARHVTSVGELSDDEAAQMGPLLRQAAGVVDEIVRPEQVYVGLWSHAGRRRVHIHFVVQPATTEAIESVGDYGPALQATMFDRAQLPPADEVELFAERARRLFRLSQPTRGTT
ncbi:MAG: adenylyltransferase [Actinomycetota bacterium]|nr:adenylyltransferase [Actinomycetota bacterium]